MDGTGHPGRLPAPHARGHSRVPRVRSGPREYGESISDRCRLMRLLADENVPIGVVEELIAASHEVEWVATPISPSWRARPASKGLSPLLTISVRRGMDGQSA